MSRQWEQGAAKRKTIILLLVLGGAVYVGVKVGPPYFANYQLQDKMWEEARFAQANRLSEEDLRNTIYREAQRLDIPLRPEDIHVELSSRGVRINANYAVAVDLRVYQFKLYFTPTSGQH
jgi:hypothetical protein